MSIWTVYIHNNVNQDLTNNDINSIDLVSVKGCWVIGSDITDELQTTKFIEKVGEVFLSVITFYIAAIWRLLLPKLDFLLNTPLQLQINLEGVNPPCIIFFVCNCNTTLDSHDLRWSLIFESKLGCMLQGKIKFERTWNDFIRI